MKTSILTLLTVMGVSLFALDAASQEEQASDPLKKLLEAADDSERREAAAELIAQASNEKIRELKVHPHPTIALYAAWEQVRRTVRIVPEYEVKHPEPVKIDRQALQQFIGFVKGRLQVPLPEWWETRLAEAYIYPDDATDLWFKRKKHRRAYSKAGDGIYAPNEFTAKLLPDGDLELTDKRPSDGSCRIPARFLEKAKTGCDTTLGLTASIDADHCIFGFHGSISTAFTLHCMDRKSSAILWSAMVFNYQIGGFTGAGHIHWVAIRQRGDTVYLFGTNDGQVYIEGFSMKDGTNWFRFCTDYYW